MNHLIQSLNMGGYAQYVWPAYGLVFLVFILNWLGNKWKKKQTHHILKQWFKR